VVVESTRSCERLKIAGYLAVSQHLLEKRLRKEQTE
jgi:hypothetical protein